MIAENILFELGSKSGLYGIRKRWDGLGALGVYDDDTVVDYAAATEICKFILFVSNAYIVRIVIAILYTVRITRFAFVMGGSHSIRSFKEPV